MEKVESIWKGSTKTFEIVFDQIKDRYGLEEAKNYDPLENCFTYNTWAIKGYQVKKGEKALKSITWVTGAKKKENGDPAPVFPKTVNLFYKIQVEPSTTKECAE